MDILCNLSEVESYSYSKLNSFYNCKYAFKKTYIDGDRGIGNSMGDFGSLVHGVLEDFLNGNIQQEDMKNVFIERFNRDLGKVEMKFSSKYTKDCSNLYVDQVSEFLSAYDGHKGYIVRGVEKKFDFLTKIHNKNRILRGVIDLLLEDFEGNYIIVDYKSKGKWKSKEEADSYFKQLYFYSMYVIETYKIEPSKLRFIQFRVNEVTERDFDREIYEEVMKWVEDTIKLIDEEEFYEPKNDEKFFCHNLCNHRETCSFLPEF